MLQKTHPPAPPCEGGEHEGRRPDKNTGRRWSEAEPLLKVPQVNKSRRADRIQGGVETPSRRADRISVTLSGFWNVYAEPSRGFVLRSATHSTACLCSVVPSGLIKAADISVSSDAECKALFDLLRQNKWVDLCLWERSKANPRKRWIHVQWRERPRGRFVEDYWA